MFGRSLDSTCSRPPGNKNSLGVEVIAPGRLRIGGANIDYRSADAVIMKGIPMETNEPTNITIIGWPTPDGEPAATLTGYARPEQESTALAAFAAAISRSSPDEVVGAVLWDSQFDQSRFHEAADSSLFAKDSDDWLAQNPAAVASARERLIETVTKYLFGPNPARVDGYLNTGQFVSVFNDSAAAVDEQNDEYQAVVGLGELPELSPYWRTE